MPKKAITIHLEGSDIPIEDFSEAVAGWVEQLSALREEVSPNARIKWVISELQKSSAICTISPEIGEGTSDEEVDEVMEGYKDEWQSFKAGVPSRHSYGVQSSTRKIFAVLNGRVPSISTKIGDNQITVTTEESRAAPNISKGFSTFGAVTGKIQTISMRSTNHFLLFDLEHDHKITCYLRKGSEDIMRENWGKIAIVEGELYRDFKTGRVQTVRDITVVQPTMNIGNWRDAVGISPPATGREPPEDAIRRMRG